jgi:hypothetical protein
MRYVVAAGLVSLESNYLKKIIPALFYCIPLEERVIHRLSSLLLLFMFTIDFH